MRKTLFVVLVGIVVMCGLPTVSLAQGFLGLDAVSSLGGFSCGKPGWLSTGVPSLYFGWLEHRDGSVWALRRVDSEGTARWPLRGLWLGATSDLSFDNRFGLILSGGIFLPNRGDGTWITRPDGDEVEFRIPSYDWWYVDGTAKMCVWGHFEFLAGFRWDHTSVRVDFNDNTSDDYILNAYIPLIGTQVSQRFSNGSLLLRLVGSPLVPGNLRYHFWTRDGYSESGNFRIGSDSSFVEILADYRWKLRGDISLGAFAKWDWLRVKTGEKNLSDSTAEPVGWSVDIRSWTLGGVASLDFSSPL